MTGLASVLKGVQPDLRDTIKKLHREGWTPSKTSGGHIRLEHAEAAKPVFTSSTPSDFRTPFNLVRDCRSALMGTARCPDPSASLIGPEQAAEILSSHKRRKRHAGRPTIEGMPGLVAGRISESFAKNAKSPVIAVQSPEPIAATPQTEEGPMATPVTIPTEETKELTEMNMIAHPETTDAAPVSAVTIPGPTRARSVPRGTARPARTAKPAQAGKVPTAPVLPERGATPLDQEAVRIGMMIARGELTTLVITPEMVGQTLVFTQTPYLIGAPVETASAGAPQIIRRNLAFNDVILDFLRTFTGEDVPVSMISEHMVSKGHYKPKSARVGVRSRLEQLVEAGAITLSDGPGEIHARLIG